jgi:hypothetical protein
VGISFLTSPTSSPPITPHIENEMGDLFPPIIAEEDNASLCSMPAKEEILSSSIDATFVQPESNVGLHSDLHLRIL